MNTKIRFILVAVLVASIVAVGTTHGAWAKPGTAGTVPNCPLTNSQTSDGSLTTCSSAVVVSGVPFGGGITVTEIDLSPYGYAPGSVNYGPGVSIEIKDKDNTPVQEALLKVCFPDPTNAGMIYRWWSSADLEEYYHVDQPGKWLVSPTFYDKSGLTCTLSWLTGILTIVY